MSGIRGRRSVEASNGFPYAGGEAVEVALESVEAIGRISIWRSNVSQTVVRLEGGSLVHFRLEEQSPDVQELVKARFRHVRLQEASKEPGWAITWRQLPP